MTLKFSLIAAAEENNGIGKDGKLPWHLKQELKYFNAQTKKVQNPSRKNAVIMGRKTYFGIPADKRPLPGRINIVLSKTSGPNDYPSDVLLYPNLDNAMTAISSDSSLQEQIENIWIVGGYGVYKEAMESSYCHRVYLTKIMASFDCDTFFPKLTDDFRLVPNDEDIPSDVQEENGVKYQYQIFEKAV